MFKKILFLGILCALSTLAYAEEDSITITTYYPSPYGSYNQLQANSLGVGDNNGNSALESGDVPSVSGDVWIAGKVGIGTTNPFGSRLHAHSSTTQGTIAVSGVSDPGGISGTGATYSAFQLHDRSADMRNLWTIAFKKETGTAIENAFHITRYSTTGVTSTPFVIQPNGNVGIGTTTPSTNRLEVDGGPIKATGGLIIEVRNNDPSNPEVGRMWLRRP